MSASGYNRRKKQQRELKNTAMTQALLANWDSLPGYARELLRQAGVVPKPEEKKEDYGEK